MGSITGKRIRELKGRDKKKPLIFQPRTQQLETALIRHTEAYAWLGMDKKNDLSPKLWRNVIDLLIPLKGKKDRQNLFNAFIADEWTNPRYRSKAENEKIQSQEEKEAAIRDWAQSEEEFKMDHIFDEYSGHYCDTKLKPKIPGDRKSVNEIHFQASRTGKKDGMGNEFGLYLDEMSKVPKPFYKEYLAKLTTPDQATAKKLVRHILDLARYGRLWKDFLKSQNITIKEMDHTHCEYYPSWRKNHRLPGHGSQSAGGKTVGVASITKEVQYFRQACKYALVKKLITSDPSITLRVDKKERKLTDKEKPLDLTTLNRFLAYMDEILEDHPNEEAELNIKSIYFILLTGCRPSEIKNYAIDGALLHFNIEGTGKTKQAVRAIPLTPRLKAIALDPLLAKNKETPDVSTRIYQWLRRRNISSGTDKLNLKINPYRFRHTCATILLVIGEISLQEIAYRLGHSDSGFTQRVYGNMGVHLKKGDKGLVKQFWKKLNGLEKDLQFIGGASNELP